ncbi:uncharacterized protein LOC142180020 [Nicotiana tabacum]|uniref:Uncharacterized protein LOC142180020 n=1 Tax=Nicotiana tabacum TaxID=4097 RepID=A0AC58UC18_TOBAC
MVHNLSLLVNPKRLNGTIQLPIGNAVSISHIGSTYIVRGQTISNVLHIPDFKYNLLSVSKLTKEMRWAVMFFPEFCIFQKLPSGQMKGIGREDDGLYIFYSAWVNTIDTQVVVPRPIPRLSTQKNLLIVNMITKNRIIDVALWHKRLRHVPTKTLKTMNVYSASMKVFSSDNGSEFLNSQVVELLQTKGIIHQSSCIYTPQQNGVAEKRHWYILEVARSLRFQAFVPLKFWDLNNPILFSENKLPPYHFAPNVTSPDDAPHHNHSESDLSALHEDIVEPSVNSLDDSVVIPAEPISSILATVEPVTSRRSSRDSRPPIWLKDYITHNKGKAHCCYPIFACVSYDHVSSSFGNALTAYSAIIEPQTFDEVVKDPKWIAAMKSEISALEDSNTWSIVPLPPGKEGLDYTKTFSPVVKMVTVRSVLAIAAAKQWYIYQMNVHNAFSTWRIT